MKTETEREIFRVLAAMLKRFGPQAFDGFEMLETLDAEIDIRQNVYIPGLSVRLVNKPKADNTPCTTNA